MARKKPAKIAAYQLVDGSATYFVRGTTNVDEALFLVLVEYPDVLDDAPEDVDTEPVAHVERTGYFRFPPCWCGEEYSWHLDSASKPGRGVFEGVWLDVGFREVEFACDEEDLDAEVA